MHVVSAPALDRLVPPRPFDPARAEAGLTDWRTRAAEAGDEPLAGLADKRETAPLLEAMFGNSPFLTRCVLRDPIFTGRVLREGPEEALAEVRAMLGFEAGEALPATMRRLRRARERAALAIGIADISGAWDLERVIAALSDFAEAAVSTAVDSLLGGLAATGNLALPDRTAPSDQAGYVVLAMGKFGARELNYSSDIDLIVLYDPERAPATGRRPPSDLFTRLTRDLIKVLQERTEDGYVFRVDLRLRPDPGATPIALPVAAAEAYYESIGQNWERAAMIKARPVAGDRSVGQDFLETIRPFVWRKHLDFAAVQDVHAMTRLIRSHHGFGRIAVAGHDIKLGIGGIREIEFFCQIHQLISGGRNLRLRQPTTLGVLRQLAEDGAISEDAAAELCEAYIFLRRLEHRLQMINDEQTQTLPASDEGLEHVACFMGYPDRTAFETELLDYLRRVEARYNALLDQSSATERHGKSVDLDIEADGPALLEALTGLGFRDAEKAAERIRTWPLGRYPALRSERARALLRGLTPAVLERFGRSPEPDLALCRFDDLLCRLPAGVQLFSLFNANPRLLDLVAEILGGAPALADALTHRPSLLEGVLRPDFHEPLPDADTLERELLEVLAGGRDFQDVLDLVRRWANERKFQVGIELLLGQGDGCSIGRALSDVAEAVLRALLPAVEAEFARTHGRIPGGDLAVVAMGKLGAREMTLSSDLDLVLIYEAPDGGHSTGKALSAPDYYARLSKRLINAITALTGEGRLYEVDMRLRPSGSQGPIAVSLAGFQDYQCHKAWTWERMALTRARTIIGSAELRTRIESVIRDTIARPEDPAALARDVVEMRTRIAAHQASADPWDVKFVRGGLVDLDFIAQFLILSNAAQEPECVAGDTAEAFRRLGTVGALDPGIAAELEEAVRLLLNVQHVLRLWGRNAFAEEAAPSGLKERLAALSGLPDLATLRAELIARESRVHALFEELVERTAERAGQYAP